MVAVVVVVVVVAAAAAGVMLPFMFGWYDSNFLLQTFFLSVKWYDQKL